MPHLQVHAGPRDAEPTSRDVSPVCTSSQSGRPTDDGHYAPGSVCVNDERASEQVATLALPDVAGVRAPVTIVATADGRSFFYTYVQNLSNLFLVSTLQ